MADEVKPAPDCMKEAGTLGRHAVLGSYWSIAASVLNKALSVVSQVLLAWYLVPADFGLLAMAASASSIASLVSGMNLKTILIQETDRFGENVGHVFWLSLLMNLCSGAGVAVLAPLASMAFGEPQVMALMLVVSAASPFMALPTIYSAALNRELRFRSIALLQGAEGLIKNVLAVLLAMSGFGAYALVLPLLLGAALSAGLHRWVVGKLPVGRPRPKEWPRLLSKALWLMLNAFLTSMLVYGANLVIGLLHDKTVTGLFFWGFSLASQAVFLLATNLQGVFFPILAKLTGDESRQEKAFDNAVQVLTLAVVPVCVLQALLARPIMEMVFAPQWWAAIAVVQWLSLGMMTQPLNMLSVALLMARGEFRLLAKCTAVSFVVTMAGATLGAALGKQDVIAIGISLASFIANCVPAFPAVRSNGRAVAVLLRLVMIPILMALPALIGGFLMLRSLRAVNQIWQAGIVGLIAVILYVPLTAVCFPQALVSIKRVLAGNVSRV